MRLPRTTTVAALLAMVLATLWATGLSLAAGGERQRIADERLAVGALYDEMERNCQQKFAVTSCVDEVRARRREALAPLRERELRLDETDRSQRAAERRAAVAAKQQAALSRVAPAEPMVLVPRLREAPASAAPAARAPRPQRAATAASGRAQDAASRAQLAQQRRDAARATQERVARRLAEREKSSRRSPPLPLPGASAADTGRGGAVGAGVPPR
jgi:colicin import membrane protein